MNRGVPLAVSVYPSACVSVYQRLMKLGTHVSNFCTLYISGNQPDCTDISYSCHTDYRPLFVISQDIANKFTTSNF